MADRAIENARCDVCGIIGEVQRTYYHYDIKCECHSPNHFEIVRHHEGCVPRPPTDAAGFLKEINGWTDEQVKAAEDWAGAVHFKASDNEGVVVPSRPDFLAKYDGGHAPQGGCCG